MEENNCELPGQERSFSTEMTTAWLMLWRCPGWFQHHNLCEQGAIHHHRNFGFCSPARKPLSRRTAWKQYPLRTLPRSLVWQIPTLLLLSTVGMKYGGNEALLSRGRFSAAGDMANRNAPGPILGVLMRRPPAHMNGLSRRRPNFSIPSSHARRGVSWLRFRPDLVVAQRPHEHFLIYRLPGIVEHRRDAGRAADSRALPGNDDQ
jgi:hypothetical protein